MRSAPARRPRATQSRQRAPPEAARAPAGHRRAAAPPRCLRPRPGPPSVFDRARPGDRREVRQADLDRDRAPLALLALQRLAQVLAQPPQDRLELRVVRDVLVEGPLVALRDDGALGLHAAVVLEVRAPMQEAAEVGPEALDQGGLVDLAQRGDRRDPDLVKSRGRLRPDPGNEARREAREPLASHLAAQRDHPAGLLAAARHLGDELVRADAHRRGQARLRVDAAKERAQERLRRDQIRDVEVGLVDSDLVDQRHLGPHQIPHPARHVAVRREVGRDDDRVRAESPRLRGGHGRVHSVGARLVGRGGDDRARSAAGDDHRPPPQLGRLDQLDARIERIEVHVGDDAAHASILRPGDDESPPGQCHGGDSKTTGCFRRARS